MYLFSKTLYPPILDASYPAFRYESNEKGNVEVRIPSRLSVTNTISQVDHVQIKIVSSDTDRNGLNPAIYPQGYMFKKIKKEEDLNLLINTVVNGKNIFAVGNEAPYASYYKIQIRLGEKGDKEYNESWGQNPPTAWLTDSRDNFSEWSNSAVLKTVPKPDVGIFGLEPISKQTDEINIIKRPDFVFQGWYNTSDLSEPLIRYEFTLSKKGELIETSGDLYVGEYETPTLKHSFKEVFEKDTPYTLTLSVESANHYIHTEEFNVVFDLSFVKIYNVFDVEENEDGAYNLISMTAKQLHLRPSHKPVDEKNWLEDLNMKEFGEFGKTHYHVPKGEYVFEPESFGIPYNTFSILVTVTNFKSKIAAKMPEATDDNHYLFEIQNDRELGSKIRVGAYKNYGKTKVVLEETLPKSDGSLIQQRTSIEIPEYSENTEYIILIKKALGDTHFEIQNWHTNDFVGGA